MKNRLPEFKLVKKICIICEGFEENDYLEKLETLDKWNGKYTFKLVNAEGNGKIAARYQEKYSSDSYDLVLVFCDTDKTPFKDYDIIKEKIDNIHGVEGASDSVVIFANPCTMQVILMHFENIMLSSHKKQDNKTDIKRLTGVKQYSAKKAQREELCNKITNDNYEVMKANVCNLSKNDKELNSSNFGMFISYFEGDDLNWIDEINGILESGE